MLPRIVQSLTAPKNLVPMARHLCQTVGLPTGNGGNTGNTQSFSHALPGNRRGESAADPGRLPRHVVQTLRGSPGDAARECYGQAVKGAIFRATVQQQVLAAVPKTAAPPPEGEAVFDVFQQLSDINRADTQRQCAAWTAEFERAAGPAAGHRLGQVKAIAQLLRHKPLELTHFASEYPVQTVDGTAVVHLLSDAEKRRQGAKHVGSESIDMETINLEDAVYCAIQTPGVHGKHKSRFGSERYACLVDEAGRQLERSSLLMHDFAYLSLDDFSDMFYGTSGSTGSAELDRQMLASLQPGAAPATLTDRQLSDIGVSVRRFDEATHDLDTNARAGDLYRHARDATELRECLAEAVEARLLSLLARCTTRLTQLREAGLQDSPASIAVGAVLRHVHEALDCRDARSLNLCLNRLGLRPQVLVPGSFVVPSGKTADAGLRA